MHCQSLNECFEHISAYADGKGTGYPLIVNTDNYHDYQEIIRNSLYIILSTNSNNE